MSNEELMKKIEKSGKIDPTKLDKMKKDSKTLSSEEFEKLYSKWWE